MTDAAETPDPIRRSHRLFTAGLLAVTALSLALNFSRLGATSLKDTDEAIEALTSREMLRTADWLTPRLNGAPRYTKPPLYFWLAAGTFRVLGQSELALRFWSAAAGTGAVLLTGLLGRRLFGPRAGVLAALALATSARFVYSHGARNGCLDAVTTFWIALGMLCFVSREANPRLLIAAGLAFGLASLTKNFLGLPAAGLAGAWLYATRKRGFRIPRGMIGLAAAALLAVSFAWPLAMAILHGRRFVDVFLLRESLGRFRFGHQGHPVPGAFPPTVPRSARVSLFAKTLFDGFFPWSLLAPLMIPWTLWRLREWKPDDRALIVLWAGLYAAAMLSVGSPFAWYAYPFYPAVALAIGVFIAELLPDGRHGALLTAAAGVLAAAAILFRPRWIGDAIRFSRYQGLSVGLAHAKAAPFLALAAAAALAGLIFLRPRTGRALLVLGLAAVSAAFGIAPLRGAPQISHSKLLANRIEALAPAYGNAVTFLDLPFLAPTGEFTGMDNEARWYLFGIRGVAIRNLATEVALPAPPSGPKDPVLVLTHAESVGGLPPHRIEDETLIWNTTVALAGIPGRLEK